MTFVLSTSPVWAGLMADGAAPLVLIPVIRTTAEGRPFAHANDRRLAVAAAVTAAGCVVATVGPFIAAHAVLRLIEATLRCAGFTEYVMPAGWLVPDRRVAWWPLLVIGLLLWLAAATRQGTRLATDEDGLV